jgi:multiple sugar transport system permease protein
MNDQQVLSELELGRQAQPVRNGYRKRPRSMKIWKTGLQSARMMLVLAILLLFLLPILYLIALSLKTPDQILQTLFFPAKPTLANWLVTFAQVPLTLYVQNSFIVATLASLITLGLTLPATYAICRLEVGRGLLPSLALGSYVSPPVVALIPLFFLAKWSGLIHTLPGLIFCYALLHVPVALWLLTGFMKRIPKEIDEAAAIDGAGILMTLWQIIIPLISPGVVSTGIICAILNYNEFLFAFFFTANPTRTLPIGVALFQGERLVNFGQMAVASLIGVIPIYLVSVLFQRWLVSGLANASAR